MYKIVQWIIVSIVAVLVSACGCNGLSGGTTTPVFTSAAEASIVENKTDAITVKATGTGTITYSITGGDDASSFTIGSTTGAVTFDTAPDYETKTSYSFIVTATDDEGNSIEQTVTITVLNDLCTNGDEIWHLGTVYCPVASPYTERVWLDRNLGASQVCTAFDDAACCGDYYQWGRNADGHEKSDSSVTDVQATNVDDTGHGDYIDDVDDVDDWAKAADSDGSLRSANWSKTDGTSACPVGYRVATIDELKAELLDADSAEIQKDSGEKAGNSDDRRINALNSFLKLPSSGSRSYDGSPVEGLGEWGDVWANSVDGSQSLIIEIDSGLVGWFREDSRAYGLSVRCLKP